MSRSADFGYPNNFLLTSLKNQPLLGSKKICILRIRVDRSSETAFESE
jgi:hypothetical protein